MRIVFCIDYYYPHVGGGEVLFATIAEGMASLGHQVTVLTQAVEGAPLEEIHNGVRIQRIATGNSRIRFMLTAGKPLLALAAEADIIHASTYGAAMPARWVAKKLGKPFALTVHEVWIGKWQRVSDASWLKNFLYDCFERLLFLRPYPHYIAVSHSTARDLEGIGVPPNAISTIYNGVDTAFWNAARHAKAALPQDWAVLPKRHVFFFSGRPGCSKGLPTLLHALAQVVKSHPEARLLAIVSNAKILRKAYRQTEELIIALGLGDYVRMVPSIPYQELPSRILSCDTVVVPSLAEGFGFAAAEACALDMPIIASDTAALPEVVSGKVILTPPRDSAALAAAMLRAIDGDYDFIPKRDFPLQSTIEKHLALYNQLQQKQ